jgi:hypothetical protein
LQFQLFCSENIYMTELEDVEFDLGVLMNSS